MSIKESGEKTISWRADLNEGELILPLDPIAAFQNWLRDAVATTLPEPTAMTLATADQNGRPHARVVLFKGVSVSTAVTGAAASKGRFEGLEFYTNFTSPKSQDLIENPFAALVFHWPQLRRQIRFEGAIEKLSAQESEPYFQSRARGSRIGAWSSPQSQKIESREFLGTRVQETEAKFGDGPIPCPPFWGGWRLVPDRVEFWEERPFRLHERRSYSRHGSEWRVERLAP